MKAVTQRAFGGPEVLVHEELPDPVPAPGEVLLRVAATALNRLDVLQREGPPLVPGFGLPHIAGMDVAGTVVGVGEGVSRRRMGQRVLVNPSLECGRCARCLAGDEALCGEVRVIGGTCPGGYAELCAVPADHAHPVPNDADLEVLAAVPTVWATAWHALVTVGRLRAGETFLVHAAGSGVSIAAIQIAAHLGARVVATARSEAKLALATELGADAVVLNELSLDETTPGVPSPAGPASDRPCGDVSGAPFDARRGLPSPTEDVGRARFVERCRRAAGGDGANVVLDHVGAALFEVSLAVLGPRGRLLICGTTTGTRASFELDQAYHRGISILGVECYNSAEFGAMLSFVTEHRPRIVIDSRFALGDAAVAQQRLESGQAAGKILLVP